jgi:hypothetical protein
MTEAPAPPPVSPAPPKGGAKASRTRLLLARLLTVVGILLIVVSALANFVKREALDESQFRDTSRALIADEAIRNQVAATLVDELYANVDVSGALSQKLPTNLQGLSGPLSGVVREAANRTAVSLLARPRVQDAFVGASSLAQQQFIAVLDNNTRVLDTTGGKVVLDLRPIVLRLGDRFGFLGDLSTQIPPDRARVTILESDQLKTAQDLTRALRFVADWIWVLALAAWAGAIWLARGRRRIEVRAIAIGVVVAGFLVLLVRSLTGRYFVDHLVRSESVRPAASDAFAIITRLLKGAGWTAVIIGVVALVGVWLTGPGRRATSARRWLAPYLRRWEVAYGVLVGAYLLLIWWQPTPQFGFWRNVIVFFVLALIGLEAIRRLTLREFPDAEPTDAVAAAGGAVASLRARGSARGTSAELERLARLHDEGTLDDAEFAAAKAKLLGGAGAPDKGDPGGA